MMMVIKKQSDHFLQTAADFGSAVLPGELAFTSVLDVKEAICVKEERRSHLM